MSTGYYQKSKEGLKKRFVRGIKIFQKKQKAKSVNMLVNYMETVLKEKL